jgi:catechol 2,3-dioxygenase-like lactoylglutathione lyase family enzyme
MTSITSLTLEVPDPAAAEQFYAAAFGPPGVASQSDAATDRRRPRPTVFTDG